MATQPLRTPLMTSFPTSEPLNEIICTLTNQDGSSCKKKCIGEKRYRSMQEHIRRAHPENYIPKLPATEHTIIMMIHKPVRRSLIGMAPYPNAQAPMPPQYAIDPNMHHYAATTLAGIASSNSSSSRGLDPPFEVRSVQPQENLPRPSSNWSADLELPPINQISPGSSDHHHQHHKARETLPNGIVHSSPNRQLPPPYATPTSTQKARRFSNTHNKALKFEPYKRLQNEDHRIRKAYSAEPHSTKRWDDLITAVGHAADLDHVTSAPQSPVSLHQRDSLPPTSGHIHQHRCYNGSPLQQTLTPPGTHNTETAEPFPSVEGHNSSPSFSASRTSPRIYCGACHRLTSLRGAFACAECISGFCAGCAEIMSNQALSQPCPRCHAFGARYKPFQLELH